MRKFLATLLALVMTLALMVPASWGENKETYQLPDSLEGKTVILHTNDVHGAIDKYAKVAALRDECYDKGAHQGDPAGRRRLQPGLSLRQPQQGRNRPGHDGPGGL